MPKFLNLRIESDKNQPPLLRHFRIFLEGEEITSSVRSISLDIGMAGVSTAKLELIVRPEVDGMVILQEAES